ncbi:MAG: CvpA family protein [Robiginitomaculum sp.]
MEIGGITLLGFDVVVLGVIGFSAILSFARGFSRELISIIALLIGLAGALFVFGHYQVAVLDFIRPAWLGNAFLFGGVFGILYLVTTFIMRGWAKTLQGQSPGTFDRLLGLAFGMARGALLSSLFVLAFTAKEGVPGRWMTQAHTYPILNNISNMLLDLPFARAKKIAEDIKDKGKNSEILPDPHTDQ